MASFFTQLLRPFARVLSPLLHRLPKPPFRGIDRAYAPASRFLRDAAGTGARLLVMGGVRQTDRVHFLPHFRTVVIDFAKRPDAGVRADALRLPFRAASLDAAMAQGFVNHVEDPPRLFEEIRRVVRPGGALYVNTPFLLAYDPSPIDPTHWSPEGWRRLLSDWEVREIGASVGPWGAVYMLTLRTLERLTADPHVNHAAWFLMGHLLRPLLWADASASRHPWAAGGAAGIYVLAVRPR